MKKKLSYIIIFLMLFNLSVNLFAKTLQDNNININNFNFDKFVVEQIQNTFSSILSDIPRSHSSKQHSSDNSFLLCDTNLNLQNSINTENEKSKLNLFSCSDEKTCCLDRFRKYSRCHLLFSGLTKYRVNLNSYIAKIVPNDVSAIINKNIKG